MKVNHNPNYSVIEGSNKNKILEKYLGGQNESGEISMIEFVSKFDRKTEFDKRFNSIDIILDQTNQTSSELNSHNKLDEIVRKKEF